jgi:uncharacterized membrane protein
MPWRVQNSPSNLEKIIAGICYFTAGIAGIIYIVLSRSSSQSNFFRFHFLQSIILCIIALLLNMGTDVFVSLAGALLGIVDNFIPHAYGAGIQFVSLGIKIISFAFLLLMTYGAVFAFLGKYAEIPLISNIARQQMR